VGTVRATSPGHGLLSLCGSCAHTPAQMHAHLPPPTCACMDLTRTCCRLLTGPGCGLRVPGPRVPAPAGPAPEQQPARRHQRWVGAAVQAVRSRGKPACSSHVSRAQGGFGLVHGAWRMAGQLLVLVIDAQSSSSGPGALHGQELPPLTASLNYFPLMAHCTFLSPFAEQPAPCLVPTSTRTHTHSGSGLLCRRALAVGPHRDARACGTLQSNRELSPFWFRPQHTDWTLQCRGPLTFGPHHGMHAGLAMLQELRVLSLVSNRLGEECTFNPHRLIERNADL